MIIIGIDPGSKESGYVTWNGKEILNKGIVPNWELLENVRGGFFGPPGMIYALEGMQYFGKAVGKDIFETCYFIGRIMEATPHPVELVYRKDIKLFLCGTVRAKDKDIRQALIEILGKEATKGVSSHLWSALAVCLYYYSTCVFKDNLEKKRID